MSDMTIVQLMASQRERELRAQHTPGGAGDWLASFLASVFAVSIMALLHVTYAALLVLRPVCRVAKSRPAKRCATSSAIVDL